MRWFNTPIPRLRDFTRSQNKTSYRILQKGPWYPWMVPERIFKWNLAKSLRWRHNGRDSVSNHQPYDRLLNRLFRRRSKKASKLRVTGLCGGIHRAPVNSPHKWPVTRKMFPFDDVIMIRAISVITTRHCFKPDSPAHLPLVPHICVTESSLHWFR